MRSAFNTSLIGGGAIVTIHLDRGETLPAILCRKCKVLVVEINNRHWDPKLEELKGSDMTLKEHTCVDGVLGKRSRARGVEKRHPSMFDEQEAD